MPISSPNVHPAPTCCRRCTSILIQVEDFHAGREWETHCLQCGDMWWTRKRPITPPAPIKRETQQKYDTPAPDTQRDLDALDAALVAHAGDAAQDVV